METHKLSEMLYLLPTSYGYCLPSCQCGGDRVGWRRQREQPRSLRWGWGMHRDDPHTLWTQEIYGRPLWASQGLCPGFKTQQTHQSVQHPEKCRCFHFNLNYSMFDSGKVYCICRELIWKCWWIWKKVSINLLHKQFGQKPNLNNTIK